MGGLTSASCNGNSGERSVGVGGRGLKQKCPPLGIWIFSGTTHCRIFILCHAYDYMLYSTFISYTLAGSELKMGVAHPNHPFFRFSLGADRKGTPLFFTRSPVALFLPSSLPPQKTLTTVNKTCLQKALLWDLKSAKVTQSRLKSP